MAAPSKRRTTRGGGASRSQAPRGGNGLQWYGAGLASGLFLAFLLYMTTLPPEPGEVPAPQPQAGASQPRPSYDFYTVLPEQNITVDVDPADLPQRSAQKESVYLLQAGSFRQAEDADRRRGELLLLGLVPIVEETNGSNGRWYRVVLGPFENRSAMAKARSLTAQQDIGTLLIQRKSG
jgi:cell division protein FtsN